jgi:hypothetical protein
MPSSMKCKLSPDSVQHDFMRSAMQIFLVVSPPGTKIQVHTLTCLVLLLLWTCLVFKSLPVSLHATAVICMWFVNRYREPSSVESLNLGHGTLEPAGSSENGHAKNWPAGSLFFAYSWRESLISAIVYVAQHSGMHAARIIGTSTSYCESTMHDDTNGIYLFA